MPSIGDVLARAALLAKITDNPRLPSPPAIAMKVMDRASQPTCTLADIEKIVSLDPALCAKILKTVNSSFYGRAQHISTISQALVILGLQSVKTLVLGFSLGLDLRGLARALGDDELAPSSIVRVLGVLGLSIAVPLAVRPYLGVCVSLAAVALMIAVWLPARAQSARRSRFLATGLALAAALSTTWIVGSGPPLTYHHAILQITEARPRSDGSFIINFREPSSRSHLVFSRDLTFYDSFKDPRRREALVCPALAQLPRPASVLVIGGESTGVVRLVLREAENAKIVVLTDFPDVYRLTDRVRAKNGEGSVADHPRVTMLPADQGAGLVRLAEQGELFDLIFVDLPDAGPALGWPHSSDFYSALSRSLTELGIVVTRIGNVFAGKVVSCFLGNVRAAFQHARIFRDFTAGVADLSIDLLVIAANRAFADPEKKLPPQCSKVLGPEAVGYLFSLGKLEQLAPIKEPEGGCLYRFYEGDAS